MSNSFLPLLFFLAMFLFCTTSKADQGAGLPLSRIQLPSHRAAVGRHDSDQNDNIISCDSWRLAVETNNLRNWIFVPQECMSYLSDYMLGDGYQSDCKKVADVAAEYAAGLQLEGNGKDVWVFDIDETTLSNLPFYTEYEFGAIPYNLTAFFEWVDSGKAPAVPQSLDLYNKLLSLGIKIVFLTGRGESRRSITTQNLQSVGYHTWEKLLLRDDNDSGTTVPYKSGERTKLVEQGYQIVGNMGDQWSDLLGPNPGNRTFKFPDPMFYVD